MAQKFIDIVFDGPPGANPGRFVEVENESGESICAGEWIDRGDGMWALRVQVAVAPDQTVVSRGALQVAINMLRRDEAEGRFVRGEIADELAGSSAKDQQ
jgi:hypothetical protein